MPICVTQVQLDLVRYHLDSLYARASTYAMRLSHKSLDEGEQRALLDQHRTRELKRTLTDLAQTLGGFEIQQEREEP